MDMESEGLMLST